MKAIFMALAIFLLAGCGKMDCDTAKQGIEAQIAALNYCSSDADCTTAYFGCPFQCHALVNKEAKKQQIETAVMQYNKKCDQCVYGCIVAPTAFSCIENKCVIKVQETVSVSAEVLTEAEPEEKQCPACDDNNTCTEEACSEATDYECEYEEIEPCCGNEKCEQGEASSSCPADCETCTASDKCSSSSYSYEQQECITVKTKPCCGNGICDIGESCTSCKDDCTCKTGSELQFYPGFLGKSPLVVVGDEAPGQDVFTASNIANALQIDGINIDTKLASQVGRAADHDMVIIGKPCDNKLLVEMLDLDDCASFLQSGRAVIKLVVKDNNEYVLLAGYTADDTSKASEILKDPAKYDLEGTEAMIDTSGSSPKIV